PSFLLRASLSMNGCVPNGVLTTLRTGSLNTTVHDLTELDLCRNRDEIERIPNGDR
ncbi:Uncharacterized protein DAT39_006046, partial [Clarias magur]